MTRWLDDFLHSTKAASEPDTNRPTSLIPLPEITNTHVASRATDPPEVQNAPISQPEAIFSSDPAPEDEILEILRSVHAAGAFLEIQGSELILHAPEGGIPVELKSELREHKVAIRSRLEAIARSTPASSARDLFHRSMLDEREQRLLNSLQRRFQASVQWRKSRPPISEPIAALESAEDTDAAFRHFFDYAIKREQVRLRKESGADWPWSDDDILNHNTFTNVHRSDDKASRSFKAFYDTYRDAPPEQQLLNATIARWFNMPSLSLALGWQDDFRPAYINGVIEERIAQRLPIYGSAYMIPPPAPQVTGVPKHRQITEHILGLVWARARNCAAW